MKHCVPLRSLWFSAPPSGAGARGSRCQGACLLRGSGGTASRGLAHQPETSRVSLSNCKQRCGGPHAGLPEGETVLTLTCEFWDPIKKAFKFPSTVCTWYTRTPLQTHCSQKEGSFSVCLLRGVSPRPALPRPALAPPPVPLSDHMEKRRSFPAACPWASLLGTRSGGEQGRRRATGACTERPPGWPGVLCVRERVGFCVHL